MEFVSKIRWIIVIFVVLIGLIFIGWGLSTIARSVFAGTSSSTETIAEEEAVSFIDLDRVSFETSGPIVAKEEHRSYIIEVTERVVSIKVYSDYGQKVIAEESYLNNEAAFESFVNALDKANADTRYKDTKPEDDFAEKGACPTGRRYVLELGDIERRWSTSCSSERGNAGGNMVKIRNLFASQIPEFSTFIKGTNLR